MIASHSQGPLSACLSRDGIAREPLEVGARGDAVSPGAAKSLGALHGPEVCMGYAHTAYAGAGLHLTVYVMAPPKAHHHSPAPAPPQELLKDPRGARECALKDPDALSEA